jgi:uncharacterized protein (TIGR02246 family)
VVDADHVEPRPTALGVDDGIAGCPRPRVVADVVVAGNRTRRDGQAIEVRRAWRRSSGSCAPSRVRSPTWMTIYRTERSVVVATNRLHRGVQNKEASHMSDDEAEVRTLITEWAKAVHAGDMDRVLVDHSDDIVMFDVPPPAAGIRGIAAYREAWPAFFKWQARGASFDILTLDVTASDDVAFAHALLRCGTEEELRQDPENHLRLTVGLRKQNGRWVVTHEHHSFPIKG